MPGSGHGEHCGEQATGVSLGVPSALRRERTGACAGPGVVPAPGVPDKQTRLPWKQERTLAEAWLREPQSFQEQLASSSAAGSGAERGGPAEGAAGRWGHGRCRCGRDSPGWKALAPESPADCAAPPCKETGGVTGHCDDPGAATALGPQFPHVYNKDLSSKPLSGPHHLVAPAQTPSSHRRPDTCLSPAGAASLSSPGPFSVCGQLLWATGE